MLERLPTGQTALRVNNGDFGFDTTDGLKASSAVQAITAAGAVVPTSADVQITGPVTSTYAITLAAPGANDIGHMLILEMIATTSTNAVTLALTNVAGGTAAASCSFSAAGHKLILVGCASKWEVIKQDGVTLT
jgi:hypothetical protein